MRASLTLATLASAALSCAQTYQGFNYGSTYTDQSAITEPGYEAQFRAAKNLVGASGFSSARLFTSIQAGTTNTPSEAFQAAINTKTSLLLGLWASAGLENINNELAAIQAAIDAHGAEFTKLVIGVSVGSEDLYRISPIGIENKSGVGAEPDELADYISRVKQALGKGPLAKAPVGHVDTWTAYVNSSNDAVIAASDFIGTDAYPYYEFQRPNSIDDGYSLFFSAYDQTVAAAQGKPVWVTETGWPVSGPVSGSAEANTQNAKRYWDEVGCARLFGKINTFWFTLQDAFPTTPSPSFGVVKAGSSTTDVPTTPLYDLSCSGTASKAPSSKAVEAPASSASSVQAAGNNGAQRQNAAESEGTSSGEKSSSGSSTEGSTSENAPAPKVESPPSSPPSPGPASAQAPTTLITKTSAIPEASVGPSSSLGSFSGQFEYPHLIVPINKAQPDTAYGTSYNGTLSADISTIFNFDIPASLAGKTCTLVFLLPKQTELTTSSFTLSGSGGFDVERLKEPATEQTTYANQPAVDEDLHGPASVEPGNEYIIASGSCYAGARKGYKLTATGSLDLEYFQDYNPAPIGLFVTVS